LTVLHSVLANISGIQELELAPEEATALAGAAGDVMSHYNITFIDDKTTAWINLGQVMFGVYGQRIMANRARRFAEKQEAAEAQAARDADPQTRRNPNTPAPPSRQNITVELPGLPSVEMPR